METQVMIAITRNFGGSVCPVVAPIGENVPWDEAQEEVDRRLHATDGAGSYKLSSRVLGMAYDFAIRHSGKSRKEIESWSIGYLVEFYLNS